MGVAVDLAREEPATAPRDVARTMIAVEGLAKNYGDVKAVDGISFSVERGEIFSLLGHNGAGKTTTIRMLTCRIKPSSGHAEVAGFSCTAEPDRIKPLINLVSQEQNLYERMTGRQN
ncbi:MAG TPA: ATP-binding cassette domain-containing protein, partial [Patescibacteria group bacterium]|nr:ATP-binding cassette domain-containing protein [Patescibacteria group bacterium]